MKKSKFLQSSKDMLSRSFNPTKCKTSLRLAASRLKLLKNKKEVQVNQMKREIAQLLETGQDQTAKIRVEHVIREEKMMGAYDLLEIYCELSIARLPIIDTQKNCPIDMKEAITSLVFASPRCGDVPELFDIRKQFSAKYGKEFISAAIELRPQCGVSRLLVEKLSATAPDGQAKIKILSAVAEQHNIKWDPTAFDEKHSGGSSSISKEEVYSDHSHFEAAEVHALPKSNTNSSPLNSAQQNVQSSIRAENLPREPKSEPSGEEMPQLFQGDIHSSHLNGKRWNMEFKDAASAAQAAAESAERASYAARAAAELSSHGRISGQYSTESHRSDARISKDDGHETTPSSNSFGRVSEASVSKSSSDYTRLGNEHVDRIIPSNLMTSTRSDLGGSQKYNQEVSFKSKPSADDDSSYNGVPSVNEYAQEYSSEELSELEMVKRKQSSSHETVYEDSWPEKVENLEEGRVKEEKSFGSYSQSGATDYVNIFANSEEPKFENDMNPSVSFNESVIDNEAPHTSSHDFVTATFDQSDTDDDDLDRKSGPVYNEQDLEFHLHSLGRKSPKQTSINADSWNFRPSSNNTVEPAFPPAYFKREESFPDNSGSNRLREDSELDSFPAVRFDDSDGPSSESDDEDRNTNTVEDSRELSHEQNERGRLVDLQFEEETAQSVGSLSKNDGSLAFSSKHFSLSSDDEISSNKTSWERSRVNKFDADSPERLGDLNSSAKQPALGFKDSHIELNLDNESDHESGGGLNFGKLTGGLRHKGRNHLPFLKNRLDASSSVEKDPETTATYTSSTIDPLPEYKTTSTTQDLHVESDSDSSEEDYLQKITGVKQPLKTTSTTQDLHVESDSDSSEEDYLQKSTGLKQPLSTATVKAKLPLASSNSVFYSDDSDLDEHSPREHVTRKSHLRGGISRRTKASPSSSTKISNSKIHLRSEALDSDGVDRKPTTSYKTETPNRHEPNRRNSGTQEEYGQPITGVNSLPTKSNTWGSTEKPSSSKTSVTYQESKERLKSGVHDSDSSLGKQPFYADDNQEEFRLGKSEQKQNSGKATSTMVQKSKISREPSAVEGPANPKPKTNTDASSLSEMQTSTLGKPPSVKVDSTKKASHVHPKLPDYDALVQSLGINRS